MAVLGMHARQRCLNTNKRGGEILNKNYNERDLKLNEETDRYYSKLNDDDHLGLYSCMIDSCAHIQY